MQFAIETIPEVDNQYIAVDTASGRSLLVFARKQDIPEARAEAEEFMRLSELPPTWEIKPLCCHVARDWGRRGDGAPSIAVGVGPDLSNVASAQVIPVTALEVEARRRGYRQGWEWSSAFCLRRPSAEAESTTPIQEAR